MDVMNISIDQNSVNRRAVFLSTKCYMKELEIAILWTLQTPLPWLMYLLISTSTSKELRLRSLDRSDISGL